VTKPGDHPDFFRFPAPEGRSRESTIRLDAEGQFWHDGAKVEHAGLIAGLHGWIGRHPDDGRYILTNGYDWTYFTVDDVPYFVERIHEVDGRLHLTLSDGSDEAWDPRDARIGAGGAVYTRVKAGAKGGPFDAKLTRHAQASLAPWLAETASGGPAIAIGSGVIPIA
jgi:uncharacterized protein